MFSQYTICPCFQYWYNKDSGRWFLDLFCDNWADSFSIFWWNLYTDSNKYIQKNYFNYCNQICLCNNLIYRWLFILWWFDAKVPPPNVTSSSIWEQTLCTQYTPQKLGKVCVSVVKGQEGSGDEDKEVIWVWMTVDLIPASKFGTFLALSSLIKCALEQRTTTGKWLQTKNKCKARWEKMWNHISCWEDTSGIAPRRRRNPGVGMPVTSLNRMALFNFTFRCSCRRVKELEPHLGFNLHSPVFQTLPSLLWRMTTLLFQMANPASSCKSIREHVDGAAATNMNKHFRVHRLFGL